jgi:putative glycosyltransferase
MQLSVVTTLYCSALYIEEFYERISSQLKNNVDSYEIVFVDDGSPDESLEKAIAISRKDSAVKVVELSKNHGHHRAMMIGLANTCGENIFLIDCDLEEKPENFANFWSKYNSSDDIDVVYGVQATKSGGVLKKALSRSFYQVFNFFSSVEIPSNELVSRVMSRKYVETLLSYSESDLFIPGIWVDAGFNRVPAMADKIFDGVTSYSFARRITMAVDAITAFSTKPLVYIFYLGVGASLSSIMFILYLIIRKLFYNVGVDGWTSVIASIYLIGSLVIFSIGLVGIYLSRIFTEVKQRPHSIVKDIYRGGVSSE